MGLSCYKCIGFAYTVGYRAIDTRTFSGCQPFVWPGRREGPGRACYLLGLSAPGGESSAREDAMDALLKDLETAVPATAMSPCLPQHPPGCRNLRPFGTRAYPTAGTVTAGCFQWTLR